MTCNLQTILNSSIVIRDHEDFYQDLVALTDYQLPKLSLNSEQSPEISVDQALDMLEALAAKDVVGLSSEYRDKLFSLRRTLLEEVVHKLTNHGEVTSALKQGRLPSFATVINYAVLAALLVGGVVFAACQGITGLMALISYWSLSQSTSKIIISVFAALAAFVYVVYDFKEFSQIFGMPITKVKSWLKDILDELVLLDEAYKRLYEVSNAEANLHQKNFKESAHRFLAVFIALGKQYHKSDNEAEIKDGAKIKSWLLWASRNILGVLSATVWAFSGYFTGKSAAAIILGYCSYALMVQIAEPLTLILSFTGFVMAGALFLKGEFYGIMNHANFWSGIPENFDIRFENGVASLIRNEGQLTDKFNNVFDDKHMPEHKSLCTVLAETHKEMATIEIKDNGLRGRYAEYQRDYEQTIKQSNTPLLATLLLKQQRLREVMRIYQDHNALRQRYLFVKQKYEQSNDDRLQAQMTELDKAMKSYQVFIDRGMTILNHNGTQVPEAKNCQYRCFRLILELNERLTGGLSESRLFSQPVDQSPSQSSWFTFKYF